MNIDKNKVVTLSYHLTAREDEKSEETFIEQTEASNPFVFLYGAGNLLEAFEGNLKGKKGGDKFDFILSAVNGYGEYSEQKVISISIDSFKKQDGSLDKEILFVGNTIPMRDEQGHRLHGVIEEIHEKHVRMDFNHPLAGQDLHFKGEVLNVREATSEEIAHGHVHGPGGHHH